MATCTAAKTGKHKNSRTELECPVCGPARRGKSRMLSPSMPRRSSSTWPAQTQRDRRGHNFYPPEEVSVPPLHATEGVPTAEKTVVARYFAGDSQWWVVEADRNSGDAYCFARLNGDDASAEWGYVSLPELESLRAGSMVVERDARWDPDTVRNIKGLVNF